MDQRFPFFSNERGSVLFVTILILVMITIVSFSLGNSSRVEIQVAANDQFYKIAFHNADTGINVVSKLFRAFFEEELHDQALPNTDVFNYSDEGDFREEVLGFSLPADNKTATVGFVADAMQNEVLAEIDFINRAHTPGNEPGSFSFFYEMESQGDGPRDSQSNIAAVYRHVENL